MGLTALVYVEGELNPSLFCQDLGLPVYEVPTTRMKDILQKEKSQQGIMWTPELQEVKMLIVKMQETVEKIGCSTKEVLLLAATDTSIRAAKQLGMAVAGYVNPCFQGQSLAGVPMVIEGFEEVGREFLERIYRRCHGLPWTIAVTERCLLREMTLEDLENLIHLYEQPGIAWRLDEKGQRTPGFIEPLYPKEEEKAYQEAYISNMYGYYGYGLWAVIDRESGKLIGRAGLEHRDYGGQVELELGYLIDPAFWHRGIAFEVCDAILAFARENLSFPRVNALTDPANLASVRLLNKLGFVYREDTFITGSRMQRYIYNL